MVGGAVSFATVRTPSAGQAAPSHAAAPPARDPAEREAERAGTAEARATRLTGWSFAAVPMSPPETVSEPDARVADAVAGPGRPLEGATRQAMEARFGLDLSAVRVHDDARTVAATRAAGAEGLAVGADVALAERLDPASPQSRALLAHELAHVVQQHAAGATAVVQRKDGAAPGAPATTLAGLPEADRQRIQLVTTKVTIPDLAGKFATAGTKTTIPLPSGLTAAFDASVDPALQPGLSNVVGSLTTTVELTEVALVPNSTITLELDIGGTFGKGLYRFTHHAPSGAPGAKGAAKPAARVLVEALGKATAPPGAKAPPAAKPGAAPAPDPVADKIKNHSFSVPYKDAELDALRAAIEQIPDAQLAVVDGLKFRRDVASPTDPAADGDYDYKTHTVTMYDKAFTGSQTRAKGAGTVASDSATRAIVHEIGHAIDLAAIRKANVEQKTADAAVDALYKKYQDPKDPKSLKYPTGGPEEEEVKKVLKAQKDADEKVLATRAMSGTKTVQKPGGDFEDVIGTDVKGIKFREAAAKDGGRAVTAYGGKDFQEAFAEAYSLYITAPDTLKALRPNVFDYLDKNLPK